MDHRPRLLVGVGENAPVNGFLFHIGLLSADKLGVVFNGDGIKHIVGLIQDNERILKGLMGDHLAVGQENCDSMAGLIYINFGFAYVYAYLDTSVIGHDKSFSGERDVDSLANDINLILIFILSCVGIDVLCGNQFLKSVELVTDGAVGNNRFGLLNQAVLFIFLGVCSKGLNCGPL